ncbi:alpha/beta-hydrolase [Thermothelomyces heterothallicus CBS 203.75]
MSDGKALDIVVPEVGTRAPRVNGDIADFLANHPDLELGGSQGYIIERRKHMEVFALHRLPKFKVNPIRDVEFTAIRGPHGTIPIRVLYPNNGEPRRGEGKMGGIIYFHGGGYCTGSVDEFENGLRLLAEESACIVGPSPTFMYVAPGKQPCAGLASLPPAAVVTNGYDPLRDVGLAYAGKLRAVGGLARWRHYADLTHGWVQMTAWSAAARDAARDVGLIVRDMLYGQSD